MIKAYTRTLKSYAAFGGRTKRPEFWLFVLAQSLILVAGLVLVDILDAVGMLLALYLLGTLIPTLAATVRRLHDTSRGAWWLPLGVGLAPVAYVLGAVGLQFTCGTSFKAPASGGPYPARIKRPALIEANSRWGGAALPGSPPHPRLAQFSAGVAGFSLSTSEHPSLLQATTQ